MMGFGYLKFGMSVVAFLAISGCQTLGDMSQKPSLRDPGTGIEPIQEKIDSANFMHGLLAQKGVVSPISGAKNPSEIRPKVLSE